MNREFDEGREVMLDTGAKLFRNQDGQYAIHPYSSDASDAREIIEAVARGKTHLLHSHRYDKGVPKTASAGR